jgi:DNA repair photolyase
LASRRLETLKELAGSGLKTYAFVGPLLPHFRLQPEKLDDLIRTIAQTGVREVYVEHINLPAYVKGRLEPVLADQPEEVRTLYRGATSPAHRAALNELIAGLLEKHGLRLRLGQAIVHAELRDAQS